LVPCHSNLEHPAPHTPQIIVSASPATSACEQCISCTTMLSRAGQGAGECCSGGCDYLPQARSRQPTHNAAGKNLCCSAGHMSSTPCAIGHRASTPRLPNPPEQHLQHGQ
jgi:hypothetical protein